MVSRLARARRLRAPPALAEPPAPAPLRSRRQRPRDVHQDIAARPPSASSYRPLDGGRDCARLPAPIPPSVRLGDIVGPNARDPHRPHSADRCALYHRRGPRLGSRVVLHPRSGSLARRSYPVARGQPHLKRSRTLPPAIWLVFGARPIARRRADLWLAR